MSKRRKNKENAEDFYIQADLGDGGDTAGDGASAPAPAPASAPAPTPAPEEKADQGKGGKGKGKGKQEAKKEEPKKDQQKKEPQKKEQPQKKEPQPNKEEPKKAEEKQSKPQQQSKDAKAGKDAPAAKPVKKTAKQLMLEQIKKQQEEEERERKLRAEIERKRLEELRRIKEEEERQEAIRLKKKEKKKKKKENQKPHKEKEAEARRLQILARFDTSTCVVRGQKSEQAATKDEPEAEGKSSEPAVADKEKNEEGLKETTEEKEKNEKKEEKEEKEVESWEALDSDEEKEKTKEEEDERTVKEKSLEKEKEDEKEKEIGKENAETSKDKELRSPICCILGHVDTGKTKLLDRIRRTNVQEGEAGGITQQIGASYFPIETIEKLTARLNQKFSLVNRVPGLLIIDTPGHESFSNLRSRGSSLCDIAILVVDMVHGLEPQTIESIELLRSKKTPFVVALNKVDRLYNWKPNNNAPIRETLDKQAPEVKIEYDQRVKQTIAEFAGQKLNACLYYHNKDFAKYVSLVPTSAITGEGIPDLLLLLVQLTQKMMGERLCFLEDKLACTILEVKVTEGLGVCIDVILVNGVLHNDDKIVVCGMKGPIVTTVRALLLPQPLKELRVKTPYKRAECVKAAMGVKISASNLDEAVAGSQLFVVGPDDDEEQLKVEVQRDLKNMQAKVDTTGVGVYVQASTLGSLEALLVFLKTTQIPVCAINIGPIHKRDVVRASVMLDKPQTKKYAVILAFDVKIEKDAQDMAEDLGVRIFRADIIYHLFDQFTRYLEELEAIRIAEAQRAGEAVWPCILEILPEHIFNSRDPIVVGVRVKEGTVKVGTPICVPSKGFIKLGRIASIESNNHTVEIAKVGDEVAVKIEQALNEQQYMYGRQFDATNELVSAISLESLRAIKEQFGPQLTKDEICLLGKLKHEVFRLI